MNLQENINIYLFLLLSYLNFPLSLFHPNNRLNLGLQSPHHEIPLSTPPPQCGNSTLGWRSQKWRWQYPKFSVFLLFILWVLELRGNICCIFLFLKHFWAKVRHSCFLLSCNVSRSKIYSAFLYSQYFSPRITLIALFWTLSRSPESSAVRELCQTVADCSSRLLMNNMYTSLSSPIEVPKLATFLSSSILELALLTMLALVLWYILQV